jgi:hypothetical protein
MGTSTILPYGFQGKKTNLADNTATDIIKVYVPNANAAFAVKVTLLAVMNGSTDDHESARVGSLTWVGIRQTGANLVTAASTIAATDIATTSGGGTITLACDVSSVSGAATAENTAGLAVTVAKTGTITDHTVCYMVEIIDEVGNVRFEKQ